MKVSGMGPVARMLFRALALTTVWGATCAFADGVAVLEIPPESVRLLDFGAVRQK